MISLNILVQLILVVLQNGRKPRAVILREMVIVLSCCKPGVDAYRVLKGEKKDLFLRFDPLMEMVYSKGVELVLEAIGGSVLQTTILINFYSLSLQCNDSLD